MSQSLRGGLAVLFVLSLIGLGGSQIAAAAANWGHPLLAEVGRAVCYGTLGLLLSMGAMHGFDLEKEYGLRVIHLAWGISLAIPAGVVLAHSATFPNLPTDSLVFAFAFAAGVWVTYWGARLILEGRLRRDGRHSPYYYQ